MRNNISFSGAKKAARLETGRDIRTHGFEEREIAGHIVNILFYSYNWQADDLSGETVRMKIWVDGKPSTGLIL